MATGIYWDKSHIIAEHWKKGYQENTEGLPDFIAPNPKNKRENILRKY